MTSTAPDLAPQARAVSRLVAGVADDQLDAPTPCADTPVAGLLDHLDGLALAFRLVAEKTPLPGGPPAFAAALAPDWRDRLPRRLDDLAAAWRVPAAWAGLTEAGGVQLPAQVMGLVALNEVLVHGWDLAVAIGQPYDVDDAALAACLQPAVDTATGDPEQRDALDGPVVPVPGDAPPLDRLLGLTGRDPAWTPAAARR